MAKWSLTKEDVLIFKQSSPKGSSELPGRDPHGASGECLCMGSSVGDDGKGVEREEGTCAPVNGSSLSA